MNERSIHYSEIQTNGKEEKTFTRRSIIEKLKITKTNKKTSKAIKEKHTFKGMIFQLRTDFSRITIKLQDSKLISWRDIQRDNIILYVHVYKTYLDKQMLNIYHQRNLIKDILQAKGKWSQMEGLKTNDKNKNHF